MKKHFKIIIHLLSICSSSFIFQSCNIGDFGDTNENPNATSAPITSALLSSSITAMGNTWVTSGLYCQYFSESQYTDGSRYSEVEVPFWQYDRHLYDLENIILTNTNEKTRDAALSNGSHNNQIAVARILKVFFFIRDTDALGDVPYFEALKANPTPVYDTQESIYQDLFKELDEAVQQFEGGIPAQGDILFNGDIPRWKKFANSLRLILALHVSEADPGLGKSQVLAALAADEGVIEDNADNVTLYYPGGAFRNPWYDLYSRFRSYGLTDVFVNFLKEINDPRQSVYGSLSAGDTLIGIPYGLPRDQTIDFTGKNTGWALALSPEWRHEDSPFVLLSAADVYLARSEAAALGWTNENTNEMYSAGIRASLERWQVFDQTIFDEYMAGPGVALTDNDILRKIRFQRYLSFFPDGNQGWTIWRRTGVPNLQPTPYAVNASGQIPRRYTYWAREANLNAENYKTAVERLGGDTMDGRVWWDK